MTGAHLAIVGPTASGKSALALHIAQAFGDYEVVVADSMQGYRTMDIGTAKPTLGDRSAVPHHLVDVVDPSEEYSLPQFLDLARRAIDDIERRGKRALLVGGTGLYVQALLDGYDVPGNYGDVRREIEAEPDTVALFHRLQQLDGDAAQRIEPANRRRIVRALEVTLGSGKRFSSFEANLPAPAFDVVGIWLPRSESAKRIEARVHEMLAAGWQTEVEQLIGAGHLSKTAAKALGYSDLIEVHEGKISQTEAVDSIVTKTKALARRQRVWFRRDERVHWYGTGTDPARLSAAVLADLETRVAETRP